MNYLNYHLILIGCLRLRRMKSKSSTYSKRGTLGGCKILLLLLCATALVSFSANKPFTDFSGKWYSGSANASFDIKLIQVKGRVSGSHCAIQLGGSKVESDDVKVYKSQLNKMLSNKSILSW